MKTEKTLSQSLQVNSNSDLIKMYLLVKIRAILLLVIVHLQEANILQQKLETEVSIFVSMAKNEKNCGKTPVFAV